MGVDWYANAVIGCEVTGKLMRSALVPGCTHPQPDPLPSFCSQCGKKTTLEEDVPIDGYDPDEQTITTAHGTVKVTGTTDDKRQFAGVVVSVGYYDGSAARMATNPLHASTVRDVLEPLGLWDPTTFGVWAVLRAS